MTQSTFVSKRAGTLRWNDIRRLYQKGRRDNYAWWIINSPTLHIDDKYISDLAKSLEPILSDFLHAESSRIGNGLFLLMGGRGEWACPTISNFAKFLIPAAVKLGAMRVAELLLGWANGEPLRFKICALLEGIYIESSLNFGEGIYIYRLPVSSSDLPASLPFDGMGAHTTDYIGGIVLSINSEMSPALYLPTDEDINKLFARKSSLKLASGVIPNLSFDSFCESMSLACNGSVDWFLQWRDYKDLSAFSLGSSSTSHRYRSRFDRTEFRSEHMNATRRIHHARHADGKPRENLDLAMRRWIRSKRQRTDLDKLIELRIALEALYEIGGLNEKGFRIATYGAWHLGQNFEQRRTYREILRKVYDDSSRVVHAGKLKYAAKNRELISEAQDICREGILKRLEESESPKWDELILGMKL